MTTILLAAFLAPMVLVPWFPIPVLAAGAAMALAITCAGRLLVRAAHHTTSALGVWLLASPWLIRLVGLALVTTLAVTMTPEIARGLVAATGTGCIAALLSDLYRQVTARV